MSDKMNGLRNNLIKDAPYGVVGWLTARKPFSNRQITPFVAKLFEAILKMQRFWIKYC